MALIQCPECGKEVSNKAKACIYCGYPLQSQEDDGWGEVKIKMPNIELGILGPLSSRKAVVKISDGTTVWEGKHGETARFEIGEPTMATIDLGGWVDPFSGRIEPKKRYTCIQDLGMHLLANYRLAEVDVIDSE